MLKKLTNWYYTRQAEHYLRRFCDFKALDRQFLLSYEERPQEARFLYLEMDECLQRVNDKGVKIRLLKAQEELKKFFQ